MKKTVTLAVATAALLAMLAGCATTGGAATPGAAEPSLADANPKKSTENFTDEMKIPYAIDLSPGAAPLSGRYRVGGLSGHHTEAGLGYL